MSNLYLLYVRSPQLVPNKALQINLQTPNLQINLRTNGSITKGPGDLQRRFAKDRIRNLERVSEDYIMEIAFDEVKYWQK